MFEQMWMDVVFQITLSPSKKGFILFLASGIKCVLYSPITHNILKVCIKDWMFKAKSSSEATPPGGDYSGPTLMLMKNSSNKL